MLDIYVSLIILVVINLSYLVILLNERNQKRYINKSREITMLKNKYNLDLNKINNKKIIFVMGLVNSVILSITYLVFVFIKNIILKLLCSFILIIVLSLILYSLVGKYFRKEMNK